jgi:opacity protein-like surface antigen
VVDRSLLYVRTGGAWAITDHTLNTSSINFNAQGYDCCADTVGSTRFGWMVGASVENAVNPTWSAKLEYVYMDFGAQGVGFPVNTRQGLPVVAIDQAFHTLKMGVNYKIDWRSIFAEF